jgi:hypothetical protein
MDATRIRRERKGRAMAKDMSGVYADMLTRELVQLRKKHKEVADAFAQQTGRKARAEYDRRRDLVAQINEELATRVAAFNLFV